MAQTFRAHFKARKLRESQSWYAETNFDNEHHRFTAVRVQIFKALLNKLQEGSWKQCPGNNEWHREACELRILFTIKSDFKNLIFGYSEFAGITHQAHA